MTMTTDSCVVTYAGNGELTEFPFNFKIFEDTDLRAVVRDADGNEIPLVAATDFTVNGAGNIEGGSVTYPISGSPLSQGSTLTLYRELPFTQTLKLVENDPFPADLIEQQFDRAVMRDRQIKERLDRALTYSMAAPEEKCLSAEEYVSTLAQLQENARNDADSARAAHLTAENASIAAASYSAAALQQAGRAEAASINVQSMVSWWSELSVAAARSDRNVFTTPGDLTSLFKPGRAVKITPAGSEPWVTGYVVQSLYDGAGITSVTVTCSVPLDIESLEYGQAVENSPRSGPAAMVPTISGPTEGNEKCTVEFTAHRNDGSDYTQDVRFELSAIRTEDQTDATVEFNIATSAPSTILLTLPPRCTGHAIHPSIPSFRRNTGLVRSVITASIVDQTC